MTTLRERLAQVPTDAMPARLPIARTRGQYAQTAEARAAAMAEVDAIKGEIMRRQHPLEAA